MSDAKPYTTESFVSTWASHDPRRVEATVQALAAAQKRIAELEAQVAQHPEQLRRVAEAVRDACWRKSDAWFRAAAPNSSPSESILALDLAAIIAEATKP